MLEMHLNMKKRKNKARNITFVVETFQEIEFNTLSFMNSTYPSETNLLLAMLAEFSVH